MYVLGVAVGGDQSGYWALDFYNYASGGQALMDLISWVWANKTTF